MDPHIFEAPFDSVSISELCGLLRRGRGIGGVWRRIAPVREELRNESNKSEHEPTSDRSTNSGGGHLIRVFRDIGHIFHSCLPVLGFCCSALRALIAHWSSAGEVAFKAEGEIWFRRPKKRFQLCFITIKPRLGTAFAIRLLIKLMRRLHGPADDCGSRAVSADQSGAVQISQSLDVSVAQPPTCAILR